MAEWLVEEGIGEHRALLKEGHRVIAARLDWPGELVQGQVEDATLVERPRGSSRGRARFASGEEALVDRLPRDASEGARIRLQVTRSAMREVGRVKLAQARPTDALPRPAPRLIEELGGRLVGTFNRDEWVDIWHYAWSGKWPIPGGGELTLSPTPAMTLIDIDGDQPPLVLALAAIDPLASAIRLLDLGGSIGIDFPTLSTREDRKEVDAALAAALADWPHERTAMNGFGFVQIVARLERPSLLHRLHFDRAGALARAVVDHAASLTGPGMTQISAHPAVLAAIRPEWLDEVRRRSARGVDLRADATLALGGWHAQIVPR